MKTFDGYKKRNLTDKDYALLAGGGHKALDTLFSALSSDTTNAIKITVGGTEKSITTSTLKTSLGLGSNAYTSTAYLPLAGGTMTGTLTVAATNKIYFPNDGNSTHFFTGGINDHFSIGYGRIQGYSNIYINADTDGTTTEYILMTAGYGISSSTSQGLKIGYNSFTWKDNTIWHAGNDGRGSGLDADLLDGYHAGYLNNNVARLCNWPGLLTMKDAGLMPTEYGTSGYGHPDEVYLKSICKWAIANNTNLGDITLIGAISPNSSGTCILHLYSNNGKDTSTLLPRYCSGTYTTLSGYIYNFGTVNYAWYYRREAINGESQPASDVYAWAKAANKPSYTYSEVGAAALAGSSSLDFSVKTLKVGNAAAGPNYIAFYGVTGDDPGGYTHTYIGERLYSSTAETTTPGTNDFAELVLFKGNDTGGTTLTHSGAGSVGPDRIRHIAAAHRFLTYSTNLSGTFETVATSSSLVTKLDIALALTTSYQTTLVGTSSVNANLYVYGNVGVGTSSPSYKLHVVGDVYANSLVNADRFNSRVATGTQPYACTSTTLNTNLNADLLDGYHASRFTRAVGGLNYKTITINGDANTYYPVIISPPTTNLYPLLLLNITRNYAATAPSTWYSATHKGGLTLTFLWNSSRFWDGNSSGECMYLMYKHETYSTMFAGWGNYVGGLGILLRGGGALYQIYSMAGTEIGVTVYDGTNGTSTTYTDAASRTLSATTSIGTVSLNNLPIRVSYSGSCSNADTLDGYHSSSFATAGHTHNYMPWNNVSSLNANSVNPGWYNSAASITNAAHTNHSSLLYVNNVGTPYQLQIPDSSVLYIYKRWYSGGWSAWSKISAGYADSAGNASSASHLYTTSIGGSGDSHASALQNYFNNYKSSIPRNCTLSFYSSAYGNGSQYMGYFLSGYNDTPYGGFFVSHYDNCYYVGISYGSYSQQTIITSKNYSSYALPLSGGTCTGNIYAPHFYENSDIRYKKILRNLSITSNTIANLPLFDFEWIENNTIGTGTSAQAVQEILPNLVSGTDKLTLDYGVLGTIAGIIACKELVAQKSEILILKERIKELEQQLKIINDYGRC